MGSVSIKKIFSFWEPREKIPAYIGLCIETWRKFLPEYDINILDYKSIYDYLDKDLYNFEKLKYFTLPKQADAIRCALLNRYGGIWLDTDTVILSKKFKELVDYVILNYDFAMLEENPLKEIAPHIGLIVSREPKYRKSNFFADWQRKINANIDMYGKSKWHRKFLKLIRNKKHKDTTSWNILGNSIVNVLLNNFYQGKYLPLDNRKIKAFPETVVYPNIGTFEAYNRFYFENINSFESYDLDVAVVCLHNSWTPDKYKTMSKEEFLSQDILLAKLLKSILE